MRFIKYNLGWIIIILLAIIPAVIWLFMLPLALRFGSVLDSLTSLGQLTGLVGAALFALALILGARLKFFDRQLNGLNRVYINHHRLGAIAFSLLLFHPLLLAARYLSSSLESALWFWLGSGGWPVILGEAALLGMIVLLILTFFVPLRYQIWKNTHKFMGLAFFVGAFHLFFAGSDVARSPLLKYYLLALIILALSAYVYHTLLGRFTSRRYLYTVTAVNNLNASVSEVILSPFDPQRIMPYQPGQFVFVNFNDRSVGLEQHPFSLTSSPEEKDLKFAIKNLGDYTRNVKNISRGTIAKVEGPYGKFSYFNFRSKKQIWIAGGIGITPFMSMARHLAEQKNLAAYNIDLYYCVRDKAEMVLWDELRAISQTHAGFRLLDFCSGERGMINAKIISELSGGLGDKDILLCGPPPMMRALKEQFRQLGVNKNNIHSEEFSL
jgi:predicted ferric reductase